MTTPNKRKPSSSDLVPAVPGELVIGDDMNDLAEQLVDQARADGIVELTRSGGHAFLLVDHAAWEAV